MFCRDSKGYVRFEKCISLARLVSQILAYKDTTVSEQHTFQWNGLRLKVESSDEK